MPDTDDAAAELERFREMFARSPSFSAVLHGPEHRFALTNPAYQQLIGHRDVIGLGVREALPELAGQGLFDLLDRVFATGEPFIGRGVPVPLRRTVDAPPELRHLDFVYQPIRDAAGNVTSIFVEGIDVTEAHATSKALHANEGYVRLLLNSSAEAFYALEPDGTTTLCNTTFLRMMGFAREEDVLGRKLHDVIHHTHPDGSHYHVGDCPIYICASTGREAHVSDELFFRPDGTPIPVEYWAKPIVVDGEHKGAICTFIDITERRQAEDRLRALNADLERQVIERSSERGTTWQVSPDLLSVVDLVDGTFIRVNPAWTETLGWPEEAFTGVPFGDFLHPDDIAPTEHAFRDVQAGNPLLRFENRYRDSAGGYRWLSWVCVPESGKLYSRARDVTEEKERARLLAERTAERDQLWDISEDLLVIADYQGRLLRLSPSWTRLLGYGEAALLAGTYESIIHPDDYPAVMGALAEMRATGRPASFEDRLRASDGSWKRIAWALSPEPGGQRLTGVGHDITRQREFEEQLRQSQKMEAVGQLTGGLAHDFNNLLTGITGSLEMMQVRVAQGRVAEVDRYIAAAQGAARRAAALTHRLLAFSRRQTLAPKPTDVKQLVAGMEELIRRTVGPAIAIETVNAAGLWPSLIDPSQLENAVLNLCINARDAMPDGGRITIETANRWMDKRAAGERGLDAGQYISLCVSDTGAGMPPDVIAKAFDPFFTTKPIGMGTGLGLSMIYGFAKQSGGTVSIYSEIGQGTLVCVYLPRHLGDADAGELAPEEREPPRAASGETVLVVDDEPTVRMLVVEVLEELGYTAIEAGDGAAALRVLNSDARIDLLVTDVGLPGGMNGRQVADAARTVRAGLKVLFITGYAENAVLSHGHLDPGMHVVTKPFSLETLASRIRELIAGPPAGGG